MSEKRHIPDSEISTVSSFTSRRVCFRLGIATFILLYFIAAAMIQFNFGEYIGDNTKMLYYLLYIPGINMLIILIIGRYALSGILYPY